MACILRDSKEIIELAQKFPQEPIASVANLVGMWLEKNSSNPEAWPEAKDIASLMRSIRKHPIKFTTSESDKYQVRTKENAEWADLTIAFATDFTTRGEKKTREVAGEKYESVQLYEDNAGTSGKIIVDTEALDKIAEKYKGKSLKVNIAGNGIYTFKAAKQKDVNTAIQDSILYLLDKGVIISTIRSGGQTGVDEAGIFAAHKLHIPGEVHTTSDYKFRDATNKDVADEKLFKGRFNDLFESKNKSKKSPIRIEVYSGNWKRSEVEKQTDKVFLFGDNTDDRLNTHYQPKSTQAVIRGLDNAIGIDTKKDRGTRKSSYFTDADYYTFKDQVDEAIKAAKDSGKIIVIPEGGIGTGKAQLAKRAPKLYNYLQNELDKLVEEGKSYKEKQQEEEKSTINGVFNTPEITDLETLQKVDLLFPPQIRRDRINLITRLFSTIIDNELAKNPTKSRKEVIDKLTPGKIFRMVANVFSSYVNDSKENRIQVELNKINNTKGAERYSDEVKRKAAEERAQYKYNEYMKLVSDARVFKALAEESSAYLLFTEGLSIDVSSMSTSYIDFLNDDPESDDIESTITGTEKREESYKDGWMTNYKHVGSYESLSQEVRKVLHKIPRLDYRGYLEKDDLGFQRYLDADYTHATLIDKLRNMITSTDMIPLLQDLSKTKPWVKKVIEVLENDDTLFSKFYQDFRKDFVQYWIQKKKLLPDGSFKFETIPVNKPEGIYYLLDEWRDNYEGGIELDEDSIYGKEGSINIEKAKKGLNLVQKLNNLLQNKDSKERLEILDQQEAWKTLMKLLHMLGINANPETLKLALFDIQESSSIKITDPIILLLSDLNVIFKGVSEGAVQDKIDDWGVSKRGDLINTFGSAYNSIALMIATVTEDAIESSARENNKSYYSHVTPNYLGKLIKNLKNVMGDPDRFEKFMYDEFKKYEWFHKDGKWRNCWLDQLENNEVLRKGLQHKVLLNHDKIDYTNWDSLDYTLVLLNEYWGDPDSYKSNIKYAWYYVPILSDSPSAEFIRFRKYITGDVLNDKGESLTYQQVITNHLVDLVNQEYDRIMLVRKRATEYIADKSSIDPITNFDMSIKNGVIESLGGAEFKFLPALNKYRTAEGTSFIDKIVELKKSGSGEDLKTFISEVINQVVEEDFEQAYIKWEKMGLFEEVSGGKYKYLPFKSSTERNKKVVQALQRAKEILGKNAWNDDMQMLLEALESNSPYNDVIAERALQGIKDQLEDVYIEPQDAKLFDKYLSLNNTAKEALREYFWNSTLATSQIIQLTTTDLAYYADLEDFQKRYKEVHAPALKLNTRAVFNGKREGKDIERTIYLKDLNILSTAYDEIKAVLDSRVKQGTMSSLDRDAILSKFSRINVADAQAYRSLSSYRTVMIMAGDWTDEMEQACENIKSGNWNIADFYNIWQTKKPYLYTQVSKLVGYHKKSVQSIDENGNTVFTQVDDLDRPIYQKVPVQNKNSEFLLLAMHELVAGELGASSKLKALNRFMEDFNIDVVQFESTVKVGKQGVIDINNYESEKDVYNHLKEATGIASGTENKNVIHELSYEDYGFQTATPEHIIDTIQLVGTQLRKLIAADIAEDAIIEIDGVKKTKKEWIDLYNAINTENIIQSFLEIDEIFKDPKKIEEVLQKEIRGNARYSSDLLRACTLNEEGFFDIPLYDPVQTQRVQQLLNSIIKSRITKQKIKGGALIQVSNFGLTEELNIVFKDKNGNPLSWEIYKKNHKNASRKQYEDMVNKARESGEISIMYFECYMPAYSKEFYSHLMKDGSHVLDINKLPEDLRKLVGYRVPTEDKYSMAPLYIKGFLPQQNGSAIMLPSDITTIAGSDFDVDKLYVMLPEFSMKKVYDVKRAWDDFYAINKDIVEEIDKNLGIALQRFINEQTEEWEEGLDPEDIQDFTEEFYDWLKKEGIRRYQFSETAQKRFSEWFKTNKDKYYIKTSIEKVKYNHSKKPHENSLKARNNLLIDMMLGVLTNKDTAAKIINPGNIDPQKRAARIIDILSSISEESLKKELIAGGVKFNKITHGNLAPVASYLFDLPLSLDKEEKEKRKKEGRPHISIEELAEKTKKQLNPLSPITQITFHQQNMGSGKLIGIYANHNSNHALMQHTELALSSEYGSFTLNGKELTSLHSIRNKEGDIISKNNAIYLGSSVDDVKEKTLASTNQNTFTADATMLLSRLGYNHLEIGLLMSQPIVLEMTQAYFRDSRNGKTADVVIEEVISKYKKLTEINSDLTYENYKNNNFYIEDLATYILLVSEATTDRSTTGDIRKLKFYQDQLAVGYLFKRILNSSEALKQLVNATKADTQRGAAGPTIADSELQIQKVNDFLDRVYYEDSFPLENADVISLDIEVDDSQGIKNMTYNLRKAFLNSKLPYLQAFFTLGVQQSERLLSPYFPHFNDSFRQVMNKLRNKTKSGKLDVKTMNSIYNDLLAYIMSKSKFFGAEKIIDAEGNEIYVTAEQKRDAFINNFPKEFKRVIAENEDIASLEFIKRLKTILSNDKTPVSTVVFKNVGRLSPTLRENFMRDWTSLMYSKNPEAQKLALNLFRYSYHRNGFAFGPNTFIHLAPTAIRKAVPEYIEILNSLLDSEDDFKLFVDQYILNHLDNRKLVPEIDEDISVGFIDEQKEIKDEITFIIDDESSRSDKKIIKARSTTRDGVNYEFYDYIGTRIKNQWVYYKLTPSDDINSNKAYYTRVEPLGFKNSFIEYEYGKEASEIKSVIKNNSKNYDPNDSKMDKISARIEAEFNNDVVYVEPKEYLNYMDSIPSVAEEAYRAIFNTPLEKSVISNDILSIPQNEDYTDANDEKICNN